MLRTALMIFGILLSITGLVLMMMRGAPGQPFLIWGAILVIAVLFERWRYRRIDASGGVEWRRTGESFEDPETGETVEVLYDPASGERRYVRAENRLKPRGK